MFKIHKTKIRVNQALNQADEKFVKKFSLDQSEVDSVKSLFLTLVWKINKKFTLLVLVLNIITLIIIILLPDVGGFLFFLLLIWNFIYTGLMLSSAQRYFFRFFASANNLTFEPIGNLDSVAGRLFEIGRRHSGQIVNVMSGHYLNWPIRIFVFQSLVKSNNNKSSRKYNYTVLEITFEKTTFPHILLRTKNFSLFIDKNLQSLRKQEDQVFNLNNSNFELTADRGYHVEVMQIFTPEVLDFLNNQAREFNIEFCDNKLNIFENKIIDSQKDLIHLYEIAKKLLDSAGPLLDRLHDDFEVLHPYYKKKEN